MISAGTRLQRLLMIVLFIAALALVAAFFVYLLQDMVRWSLLVASAVCALAPFVINRFSSGNHPNQSPQD